MRFKVRVCRVLPALKRVGPGGVLCLLAFSLYPLQVHAASPANSYGFGPRGLAMAGSGAALVEDWSSIYYNISGLTAPRHSRVESSGALPSGGTPRHSFALSYTIFSPMMHISNSNGSGQANDNARIGSDIDGHGLRQFSAIVDAQRLVKTPYNIPVRLGIGVTMLGDGKELLQANVTSQKAYNFTSLGADAAKTEVMLALSFQPLPQSLSIAIGSNISATATGTIRATELGSGKPVVESDIELAMKPALITAMTYRKTMAYQQQLFVSAGYRGMSQVDIDINISATLPVGVLDVISTSNMSLFSYFSPETLTGAVGYKLHSFDLALDVEWQRWSGFRLGPTSNLYEEPPRFNDIVIVRSGVEAPLGLGFANLWYLQVQTGYAYIPSYTPDQTGEANYLDNDKHVFGFGLKRKFQSLWFIKVPLSVEWGLQWQVWQQRKAVKSNPVALPDGSLQPNYTYGGNMFLTSLGVSFEF